MTLSASVDAGISHGCWGVSGECWDLTWVLGSHMGAGESHMGTGDLTWVPALLLVPQWPYPLSHHSGPLKELLVNSYCSATLPCGAVGDMERSSRDERDIFQSVLKPNLTEKSHGLIGGLRGYDDIHGKQMDTRKARGWTGTARTTCNVVLVAVTICD